MAHFVFLYATITDNEWFIQSDIVEKINRKYLLFVHFYFMWIITYSPILNNKQQPYLIFL
jgi:hypothetical protein